MRFYDRGLELVRIHEFLDIVERKNSRALVLTGRRRIGKTRLILEGVKDFPYLYFFTKKKRLKELLGEWSREIKEELGNVFYGEFTDLEQMLVFLLEYSREHPMALVFDEFQNFLGSDPSAFGTFQKVFDLYREKSRALLVFLGSSFSLMNKIFKDAKEPLFGRASDIMILSYLSLAAQREILADHGLWSSENGLHLFSVFDGVPRYIEELVDMERGDFKNNFTGLLMSREFMWDEGENLLKEEFGKDYASYYSILSAIAKGRRKLNEIEQFTGLKGVGPYLKNLEELYRLIERRLPITSKGTKERMGRYYMRDNFLEFWFRFIETRRGLKEIGRVEKAALDIWEQLPAYEGRKLEDMLIRHMIENNPLDVDFTRAGKYWDRKGTIEIDAAFMDEEQRKVYVFEVKVNKNKIQKRHLEELMRKALLVPEWQGWEIITGSAFLTDSGVGVELD